MANDNNNSDHPPITGWTAWRSFSLSMLNVVLTLVLGYLLFWELDNLRKDRVFGDESVTITRDTVLLSDSMSEVRKTITIQSKSTQPAPETKGKTTAQSGKSTPPGNIGEKTPDTVKDATQDNSEKPSKRFLNFIDILYLMLIAGALGGVLCNLRGVFVYYRDEGELSLDLHVPYLVRPFTGALCGIFIYFVASQLVTSITLTPIAEGIGFQGMVAYVSMAILAGFGSQEFMERLKAVVITFFGERANDNMVQKLRQISHLREKGIIDDNEQQVLKEAALVNNLSAATMEELRTLRNINHKKEGSQQSTTTEAITDNPATDNTLNPEPEKPKD